MRRAGGRADRPAGAISPRPKQAGRRVPAPHRRSWPPAMRIVAQTETHRAMAIPWTQARATRRRQVSWLAGRRAVQSLPGSRLSWRLTQWPRPVRVGRAAHVSHSPLTVAGTARFRMGLRRSSPCSLLSPWGHRCGWDETSRHLCNRNRAPAQQLYRAAGLRNRFHPIHTPLADVTSPASDQSHSQTSQTGRFSVSRLRSHLCSRLNSQR